MKIAEKKGKQGKTRQNINNKGCVDFIFYRDMQKVKCVGH